MRFRLLFFLLFIGLMMMGNAQHITMKNYQQKVPPSGLVQISQNAYRDRTPITNLDWLEYLYWLEKIYGKESDEYRAAQPDMQILLQQLPDSIATYYFRNPGYNSFPVLGIPPQQARAYCQWRTDRVAEWMLVKLKLLPNYSDWSRENCFTIENQEIPKDLKILYFFLPTENTETRYGFVCFAEWR